MGHYQTNDESFVVQCKLDYRNGSLIGLAGRFCMNLKKGIEVYLAWKATYAKAAARSYRVRLKHMLSHMGDLKIADLRGEHLVAYHQNLEKEAYSTATIAYTTWIMKDFFWFWHGRDEVNLNPREIRSPKFYSPPTAIVTQEDFEDMCDVLDEKTFSDLTKKVLIHILWDTGLRVSELCDINISDVELSPVDKEGFRTVQVRTRKTMRYNKIVFSPKTNELLVKYIALRICIDTPTDALFVPSRVRTGKGITTKSIQRWIKQIAKDAMIDKPITPHSFRHGKAHAILDQGGNVRDVQAILRHRNPASSFNYLTLNNQRYVDTAKKYI